MCRPPDRAACTSCHRSTPATISTRCGSLPATSPMWSQPTTLRTALSRCARTSGAIGCTSDLMRNAYAQTAVAPYGVRARRGAPVATPLECDELDRRGLRADTFTLRDVPKRVAEKGDPWSDIARRGRSLTRPMNRLAKIHG